MACSDMQTDSSEALSSDSDPPSMSIVQDQLQHNINLLISSLGRAAASLSQPSLHVYQEPPSQRVLTQTQTKLCIDLFQKSLASMKQLEESLVQGISRLTSSITPIGSLPTELLLAILCFAVKPSEQKRIVDLMRVCRLWRDVIYSEQRLFSEADWEQWSAKDIRNWCLRAGETPLVVRLLSSHLKNYRYHGQDMRSVIQSTKSSWSALKFSIGRPIGGSNIGVLPETMFGDNLPLLKKLLYKCRGDDDSIPIFPEIMAPLLHTLVWRSFQLPTSRPLSEAYPKLRSVDLEIDSWANWHRWLTLLEQCEAVTELALRARSGFAFSPPNEDASQMTIPRVVLKWLKSLTIEFMRYPAFAQNAGLIGLPSLQRLTISLCVPWMMPNDDPTERFGLPYFVRSLSYL